MKKINKIRNEILGKEVTFRDLDILMTENGYFSVFDDEVTHQIKQDETVVYTTTDTRECEAKILFSIVYDNGEDEADESFTMLVKDVVKF